MLLLTLMIIGIGFVAFCIDRDNLEEMHTLMIIISVLFALGLMIVSPWYVKILLFFWIVNIDRWYDCKTHIMNHHSPHHDRR